MDLIWRLCRNKEQRTLFKAKRDLPGDHESRSDHVQHWRVKRKIDTF